MQNLIFVPFAHDDSMQSGMNFNKNISTDQRLLMYLKNSCVALVSAKKYNPDTDCALVTNLSDDQISAEIHEIFRRDDIKIFHVPFDEFRFDNNTPWGLAFYKLCALSHVLRETDYKNFLYLDSDVYVQGTLSPLWEELQENILLGDTNEGLKVPDYVNFLGQTRKFYPDKKFVTRYGGEFVAANKLNAEKFITEASNFFNKIKSAGQIIEMGDEVLIAITADKLKISVRNASSYIFRFWTGDFRLVSTCYRFNAVTVLHMPSEKTRGLMKIYDNYIKKGTLPSNKKVWKMCHLSGGRYSGMKFLHRIKLFLKETFLTGNKCINEGE
ncbi:MAG: hypothetical protein IJT21_05915 [Synergistaceae bacterium]|nr:hypothetical protein [Synergistaceae bacterium]